MAGSAPVAPWMSSQRRCSAAGFPVLALSDREVEAEEAEQGWVSKTTTHQELCPRDQAKE